MKARVPYFTNKQMKIAEQQLQMEYEKIADRERDNVTRRVFKVMLLVLHLYFGFGRKRAAKAFLLFTKIMKESYKDEVFWEHTDRVVIDELKLDFERDYTFRGTPVSETELTEKAKEKGGRKR